MERLVICGWDEQTAALVRAISLRSDLRAVAIGDDRPAALVRARSATGLPCYQHLREMLRAVEYDAILVGDAADRETLLEIASERGAAILLRGDVADARSLRSAVQAVAGGARTLNVVRPELNHAGVDLLTSLVSGDADWTPHLVQIELQHDDSELALRTAVALTTRLQPVAATQVVATALRGLTDAVATATVQLRHGDEALTTITVDSQAVEAWRITVHAAAGTAELIHRDGVSTLALEPVEGAAERSELVDDDLVDLEARRLADPASQRNDERHASSEAALLAAIDGSVATGFVVPVRELSARGNLRVLEGGELTTSRREGHLRLLGN